MNDSYVWGGALAGLAIIALIGVLLARKSSAIRTALLPYLGEAPARWSVYVVWFAYVYGAISALAQVVTTLPQFAQENGVPTAISFGYGTVSYALLSFLNALVPLAHVVALVVAAVILYRHLKAEPV